MVADLLNKLILRVLFCFAFMLVAFRRSQFLPQSFRYWITTLPSLGKGYCVDATKVLSSTVHRGVDFEKRSMTLLEKHLSMSLKRVGGAGDGGIDMIGWWWIPQISHDASTQGQRRRIRVIAQCKAEKKKIGPKYIRELEGVLHRYHMLSSSESEELDDTSHPDFTPHRHISCLGLFLSESPFTKATILHAQSSSIPLLLIHLPPEDEDSPSLPQDGLGTAIWNPALAGKQGLLGGHMEIRWERSIQGPSRPGLWWRNTKLSAWIPEITPGHVERM